jgi:hypothetical protein
MSRLPCALSSWLQRRIKLTECSLLVCIHRPLSRLYHSPIEAISSCAPPPPPHEISGHKDRSYWLHTKKTLEAAEAAINLYALPIPILQHSPLGICGIALSTLANLSACAYILSGGEWYRTRDRIRLGLGGLKKFGECWKTARRTERETKKVARNVFALPRPGEINLHPGGGYEYDMLNGGIGNGNGHGHGLGAHQIAVNNVGQENLTGFEDLGGIDYLSMLENAQAISRVHS